MKPWTRRLLRRWLITGFFAIALIVLLANRWVINSTDAYIYKDWALLPDSEVGVVLGTSKYMENGQPSPEFRGRIQTAADLYKNGKLKHLIVSGANPDETNNEPRLSAKEFAQRLRERGFRKRETTERDKISHAKRTVTKYVGLGLLGHHAATELRVVPGGRP